MSKKEPTVRVKSEETILKQTLRNLNKELKRLDAAVAQFQKLQNEMEDTTAEKTKLETEIREVKDKLIRVLGLA